MTFGNGDFPGRLSESSGIFERQGTLMRILRNQTGRRLFFCGVLLILATWVVGSQAGAPEKTTTSDNRVAQASRQAQTLASPSQPEKNIAFEMRDKPWIGERGSVLEWLSDQTGMPVSTSSAKPTGTLTFINPSVSGVPKKYSLPEVIDILNGELFKQKLILIRRANAFSIEPADEKIDPAILPRVEPKELDHYGNTELVSVIFPLTSLVASDFGKEIEPMLGPFGKVNPLEKANRLVVQDTVANLKRIRSIIKDSEASEADFDTYSHTCQYILARDAEKTLRDLLGDPRDAVQATRPAPSLFNQGRGGFRGGLPFFLGGQPNQTQAPAANAPKIRMFYISSDANTNKVMVTGPADKRALAASIMKQIDVPQMGQKAIAIGPPTFKQYPVPDGNAEILAKNLQEVYKNVPTVKISSVGNNSIMVYASPSDQFEILAQIRGSKEQSAPPEVIRLNNLDASDTVDILKGIFGGDKAGAPFLKADTAQNAIVIKGTPDQVNDIKVALKSLGEGGAPAAGGTMRVIQLGSGNAAAIADELKRILPQLLNNRVDVIAPGGAQSSQPAPAPKKANGKDDSGGSEEQEAPPTAQQPATSQQPPAATNNQQANKGAPIKITAIGNRLIITSDDPQALKTAQELVRYLTQPQGGQGDYEAIRLKNASAVDAAKALDEAFNGTKQTGPQAGFPPFFGRGAMMPSNPAPKTISVVAYPPTNTLLVRASPLDMIRIRQLLKNAIDTEDTESKGVLKTWVLRPLKYANATEVANVIRDVYREYTNNNPLPGQGGGGRGFRFRGGFQNANLDANGNPRDVSLSVGVDDSANRIILHCSESMYQDVQKLADMLDTSSKDSTRTIRVVPLVGVDPLLVQQAIDAIQGRRTTATTQPGAIPGASAPSPFGGRGGNMTPGFVPGTSPRGSGPGGNQPPSGGGGRSSYSVPSRSSQSRGPDFFGYRVKDDPEASILFDPEQSIQLTSAAQQSEASARTAGATRGGAEEQQQPPPTAPATPPDIRGPRAPVTAEALEQLGVIVLSGSNPADVDEIVRMIEYIRRLGAAGEVQIQLVPLEHADATSVTTTLTALFQRVVVTASGNVRTNAPTTTTTTIPGGAAASTTQTFAASVVLLPLPRFNAILMAAPRARVANVLEEIKRLDKPMTTEGKAVPFSLKKASASRVATLLINFYSQRYPNETLAQNQIRITSEDSTNTVFVQAAPADLEEIRGLIERIDNTVSSAVNELRIVPLRNALATDMANLIVQSISAGVVAPAPAAPTIPTAPGAFPSLAPGAGRPTGIAPGVPTPAAPTAAPAALTTGTTKTISLRFFSPRPGGGAVEAGVLEDIHITADPRTNSLIVAAQAKTMQLILSLIHELDVPPPALAEVKVFPLYKSDATTMATILQQLFFGTGAAPSAAPGAPGAPGAAAGAATVGPAVAGLPTAQYTLTGAPVQAPPMVEIHITVDVRTNSLIVAASSSVMDIINAIIVKLEESQFQARQNQVIHLRYASAPDVAAAVQGFLNNELTVISRSGLYTPYQERLQDVVVFAEPITNQLLVSASSTFFPELLRLIEQLDIQAPQVVIQVLIAEVDLTATEEFGVEVGLQSPVLFTRSIIPAEAAGNFGMGGTINYANATGGLVPPGVTVNSSINPAALQGFNFNNASNFSLPLGNNPIVSPGVVGFQGLGNLGVGRASANGVGGFIFSAASNTFNLLIRALKTQGRIDILSRPQIQTTDNQTALINIGEYVPYVTGSAVTSTGLVTNTIDYKTVGVIMQVTPRISPDGTVIMRVIPEVSSVLPTQINLGNGVMATQFNVQHVETTVSAKDGETVAIGGLIQKRDTKDENKYPWLGDLPYIGALFRYRTQDKSKTELLVILTPHIVRSPLDADRILAEEARRMDWILGDVVKTQGGSGMAPILPPPPAPPVGAIHGDTMPAPFSAIPAPSELLPGPVTGEPPSQESLPQPRPMPPGQPSPSLSPMSQSRGQSGRSSTPIPPDAAWPTVNTTGTPAPASTKPGTP
jgi:general secretion pathway protein D